MDNQKTFSIRFPDMALGDAGQAARLLREAILDTTPDVQASLQKDDDATMDFGATLVLVLGTPAALVIAQGIAKWIMRERAAVEIEIDGEKVRVNASGTLNDNVARIVEAMRSR